MRGLSLADSPASLPESLLCSRDALALSCVWTFVHTNCLQSYTELPGGRNTACLPGNNAADTGELSCVPVIVLIVWMRKLRHKECRWTSSRNWGGPLLPNGREAGVTGCEHPPVQHQACAVTVCRMERPCLQGTLCLLNPEERGSWFLELCPAKDMSMSSPLVPVTYLNWKQGL